VNISSLPMFQPIELSLDSNDSRWSQDVVAVEDLPPKRDAKTDPPQIYAWVASYNAAGKYFGIGKLCLDGQWRGPDGWCLDVAFWSEILHW
jgi:hypothetical protein